MSKSLIELNGESLTVEDIVNVSRKYIPVEISHTSIKKIKKSADIVKRILEEKKQVYGVNTGFGYLQNVTISLEDAQKLQKNLILSHSSGVGSELPHEVVRGVMLLQLNKFARGHSGIRWEVVSLLVELLKRNIIPVVPSKGSLGASGDLAPLAHLSSVLIGYGEADYNQKRFSGKEALKLANLEPLTLQAKEGLALLNGTQVMVSLAGLAIFDSEYLIKIANIATALSMEIHRANIDCLHPKIHNARPHKGQIQIAKSLLKYLSGSKRVRQNVGFQDSYSLRCVPAVHGASLDTISYAKSVVETEMNSSTDNPLIFARDQIFSGGNFHGQPIALVMDYLGIAVAELGNISERRVEKLLNPTLSSLPAFLSPKSGLNSGLMITQYTAAALVSENKILASPASVDSIPVSANQEDHVSMGTIAARKARKITENVQYILAVELLCAAQAIDLAGIKDQISEKSLRSYQIIREKIPELYQDRELAPDIKLCFEMIKNSLF